MLVGRPGYRIDSRTIKRGSQVSNLIESLLRAQTFACLAYHLSWFLHWLSPLWVLFLVVIFMTSQGLPTWKNPAAPRRPSGESLTRNSSSPTSIGCSGVARPSWAVAGRGEGRFGCQIKKKNIKHFKKLWKQISPNIYKFSTFLPIFAMKRHF